MVVASDFCTVQLVHSPIMFFTFYLQSPGDQLQQQEVSAPGCQKQQPCLTGGSKMHMEHRLNGRLHCLQVDVAISIERNYNNEKGDDAEFHTGVYKVFTGLISWCFNLFLHI